MNLKTSVVEVEYRGEKFECEKTVLACRFCDFELHQEWMEEKMKSQLEEAYRKRHGAE